MVEILSVSNSSLGFRTPRREHLYSRSFSTSQRKIPSVAASEKNRDQERLVIAPRVGSSLSFIFTAATNLSTVRRNHVPRWANRETSATSRPMSPQQNSYNSAGRGAPWRRLCVVCHLVDSFRDPFGLFRKQISTTVDRTAFRFRHAKINTVCYKRIRQFPRLFVVSFIQPEIRDHSLSSCLLKHVSMRPNIFYVINFFQ